MKNLTITNNTGFEFDQYSYDMGREKWSESFQKDAYKKCKSPESARLGADLYYLNISNATHRMNTTLINGIDDTYVEDSPVALLDNTQTLAELHKKYNKEIPNEITQSIISMAKSNLEVLLIKFGTKGSPIQEKLLPLKNLIEATKKSA